MHLSIDHIFIWTSKGAPEAEHLKEFGLEEGSPNRHPGQGTACRRFFFHNAMLELLWIENETEVQSEAIRPTRLWRGGAIVRPGLRHSVSASVPLEPIFPLSPSHPGITARHICHHRMSSRSVPIRHCSNPCGSISDFRRDPIRYHTNSGNRWITLRSSGK